MSASLLEYFKAGPPAPKVVLLPDAHFFIRAVPVADATTPEAVSAQVALALEGLAPFPVEHLNHGFYWVPGAPHVLAFAAYRRRFLAEQVESWAGAELVMPTFAAVLGQEQEPATTVLIPGPEQITAVHWAGSPVPDQVLVRTLPPEATEEDRTRVREELLRAVGGSRNVIDLPAAPVIAASRDENVLLFRADAMTMTLPAAHGVWLDVRAKDELAALRKARARDLLLWRIFLGCAAALVLLAVGEGTLIGVRAWQKTRVAKMMEQRPTVEKTMTMQALTNRIDELSTKRLLAFEMLELIKDKSKRGSLQFTRMSTVGLYGLDIEAWTKNPADATTYEAALKENPAVAKAELHLQGSNNGEATYKLSLTFKPEALKPAQQP
ncbi:MAG: hypothetical protein HZA31_01355 [Opitutae bacterium]|nr:hypothetical protein [Opitutae bacterium]